MHIFHCSVFVASCPPQRNGLLTKRGFPTFWFYCAVANYWVKSKVTWIWTAQIDSKRRASDLLLNLTQIDSKRRASDLLLNLTNGMLGYKKKKKKNWPLWTFFRALRHWELKKRVKNSLKMQILLFWRIIDPGSSMRGYWYMSEFVIGNDCKIWTIHESFLIYLLNQIKEG